MQQVPEKKYARTIASAGKILLSGASLIKAIQFASRTAAGAGPFQVQPPSYRHRPAHMEYCGGACSRDRAISAHKAQGAVQLLAKVGSEEASPN